MSILDLARMAPGGMAYYVTNKTWKPYPHLNLIEDKLLDVELGRVKKLAIMMPPRHGKSMLTSHMFPAWFLGRNPTKKVILASYEASFAALWGRRARNILEEYGKDLFGVSVRDDSRASDHWEIVEHGGGMFTAGAGGALTGKGASVFIIDDPIKNSEEAASETIREKIWEWYVSTATTRLEKDAALILIMTRWHEDDLAGRILSREKGWNVIRLPAIAEEDENWGEWKRSKGEALCPDLIPLSQLEEQQQRAGEYWFATNYQQRPYPRGGGIFRRSDFDIVPQRPQTNMRVRGWDLAASTKKDAKRTAGVLLSKDYEGVIYVEDVVKGKWVPGERDKIIYQTAQSDGKGVKIKIEEEGGSGGIAQIEHIVRSLQGFAVEGVRVTGDKMTRADPVAAQANVKNIRVVRGDWNNEFFSELEAFPNGEYMDQVDALSLAFQFISIMKPSRVVSHDRIQKTWRDEIPEKEVYENWRKELY